MESNYDIIKALFHTEKGTNQQERLGKYQFWVAQNANKIQIKKAIEDIYKVKVKRVNTLVVSGKERRVRLQPGVTPDWKKAVVTLKKGDKIEAT